MKYSQQPSLESLSKAVCLCLDSPHAVVLQGHYSAVTSLCLAPDGWSLISGGRDKVVHVWDLRKNTKLVTVPVYEALEGKAHFCFNLGSW